MLAIGLIGSDGVVLTADSRFGFHADGRTVVATNFFDPIADLGRGLWAAACGDPGLSNTLVALMRQRRETLFAARLDDVVGEISQELRERWDTWFAMTPPDSRPWVALLLAAHALDGSAAPGSRLYLLVQPHFAPQRFDRGHVAIGCNTTALSALEDTDTTTLPIATLEPMADSLMHASASAHPLVGGEIHVVALPRGGDACRREAPAVVAPARRPVAAAV
jgi:hypothetical protein